MSIRKRVARSSPRTVVRAVRDRGPARAPADRAPSAARKGKKATGPKPRTGSLLRSMDHQTVTLGDALRLSHCPGLSGSTRHRRGDYRTERPLSPIPGARQRFSFIGDRGSDVRHHSRRSAEDLRRAQTPRQAKRFCATAARAGTDPAPGKPIVIKDGRLGRTSPMARPTRACATSRRRVITDERSAELLADRRAGPAKRPAKKTTRKGTARKAPAKRAAKRS